MFAAPATSAHSEQLSSYAARVADTRRACAHVQIDDVEGMEGRFVQIQGKARAAVEAAGRALGLEGTYIPKSYIEQVRWI